MKLCDFDYVNIQHVTKQDYLKNWEHFGHNNEIIKVCEEYEHYFILTTLLLALVFRRF